MACAGLVLIGCATEADSESPGADIPSGFPTIASPDFHGTFEISGVTIGGQPVELDAASTRRITLDVVTGAATVDLGCDRRLGSFTMAADGRASITLTGRIEVDPCQPSDLDDALLDVVEQVERWEATDAGFRLVAVGGDGLLLSEA